MDIQKEINKSWERIEDAVDILHLLSCEFDNLELPDDPKLQISQQKIAADFNQAYHEAMKISERIQKYKTKEAHHLV